MPVTRLAADDDDDTMVFDEDGDPRIGPFARAVQMWSSCQDGTTTVHAAALAFNASPEVIRQSVEWHPWMYLDGDDIEHDGE